MSAYDAAEWSELFVATAGASAALAGPRLRRRFDQRRADPEEIAPEAP
jgi:hypothetical protein